MFKKYPKIIRLGHEDTDGILSGECHIQEKIDGANTSIWMEDGEIKMGTRNNQITEGFNGFCDYVKSHEGVNKLLSEHPEYRLYGEWLVRHTISYNETAYKKWYMYDIWIDGEDELDEEGEVKCNKSERMDIGAVHTMADMYEINTPKNFGLFTNPTENQIKLLVGKSTIGDKGEGVVIKNMDFINEWGHRTYAKIVTENFKEENAVTFGGNNKHSDVYNEMWVVNKFMTLPRVKKVMDKLQPEVEKRLDMEHTGRIINTAYHDLITEEIWTIQKKFQSIHFKNLARLAQRKAAQIYHDILNNSISIADAENNNN